MKLINKFFVAAILAICIFSPDVSAQRKVNVLGIVSDSLSGEALIGTNILLYRDSISSAGPLRGLTTNAHGYFNISGLTNGIYILVFRNLGYKTRLDYLEISDTTKSLQLNVQMNKEPVELQEVVVKGERETQNVSTIDVAPELLKMLPTLSGETDIFRSLQLLPGVKAASEISSGLYVRGGSPDQNLTLLDGVIVYNPSHLGNFASTFNGDAVQNIKLIKGAFPAEYGGRLSSVLDIKLKEGTRERNKGSIGLGMINSYATMEGPFTDNSTYMVSGRKMYLDGLQSVFQKESLIPRYNFWDLNAKINYAASSIDKVSISMLTGNDRLYSPSANPDLGFDINWGNTTLNINWSQITNTSLFSSTSFSFTNYNFTTLLQDKSTSATAKDFYASSTLSDFAIRRQTEFYPFEDHFAKIGAELVYHSYDLLYSDQYNENAANDERLATENVALEFALFAQDEIQLSSRWLVNLGTRFYYFKEKKYFKVEPRVNLSFALTENVSFKGAYAIANQFLHMLTRNDISLPTDLWYPSNSKIKPSQSAQYILGMDWYLMNREYLLSIEGYYKDLKSIYEYGGNASFSTNIPFESQISNGKGEAYGVEFFLNKRMGNFLGWVGYTLAWTQRLFDDLNAGRVYFPRYDRRHDVSLVFSYKFSDNLSIGSTWTYATGQSYSLPTGQYEFNTIGGKTIKKLNFNYTDLNSIRLPDYHKLDLNLNYKFIVGTKEFTASFSIYNVYNRSNPFAQYIVYEYDPFYFGDPGGMPSKIPKQKQLSLFPFLPSLNLSYKF